MTAHEMFVLLAAKQISEPLSAQEQADLDDHLASCPTCRSIAAGMRRDDIRMRAGLGPTRVSPRVRRRVLNEAAGRRRFDPRLVLGLAAALAVAAIGVPLIAGGRLVGDPTPSVTMPSAAVTAPSTPPAETPSPPPSRSVVSPSAAPSGLVPSPSTSGPFVLGNYVYGTTPPRRDTLAARFDEGPVGEWSRRTPATGDSSTFYGGPVTCLVISGSDAWLAGPATTATDGSTDLAAFIHVTDGGPDGEGDTAFLWLTTPGQTIVTMTDWCEKRFIPADGLPLTTGDVVVRDGP